MQYNRKKYNLISNEEYDYWFNVGLEAFERGDKCIPARNKEFMNYETKNSAKIGSIESKKSNQIAKAWADGWAYGNIHLSEKLSIREKETPNIEVKHKGILEVPEGKNVDDLPLSHFIDLAKKKGLSKITKALNNLQVWNKNDDKKLSKWAGDMIDKLNKKLGKEESIMKLTIKESNNSYPIDLARYFLENDYSDEEVWNELDKDGYDDDFIRNVIAWMNDLYEEQSEYAGFDEPYGHIW